MLRKLVISATSAAALTFSTVAFAQQPQFGTATEARTLLERAIPRYDIMSEKCQRPMGIPTQVFHTA